MSGRSVAETTVAVTTGAVDAQANIAPTRSSSPTITQRVMAHRPRLES